MTEADSTPKSPVPFELGTEIEHRQSEQVVDAILNGGDVLLAAGSNLHPGIVPGIDAANFTETAKAGDRLYVSQYPYKTILEGEVTMMEDHPHHMLGIRLAGGSPVRPRGLDLAIKRPLLASSGEELTPKIDAQHDFEVARHRLIESHELGEGALVITNEFGGIDVAHQHTNSTAQDLVLRALLARKLGAQDLGNLVEMGLFDDKVARQLGPQIARLFRELGQNVEVLGQLPESARRIAGPPILEHLLDQAREFVVGNRFGLQSLALAVHDKEDVRGLFEFVRDYREPKFDEDYSFDAVRRGKPGYRGTKI